MRVEHVSREHIIRQIEKEFQSSGEVNATYLGVIAEHLRAGCLMMSAGDLTADSSVTSSIQLYKQAFRRLAPLFPELLKDDDEVRNELTHLQTLGDLNKVDGHHVSIAPARRLEIDSHRSLLLGGGPAQLLPLLIRKQLVVSGRSRILNSSVSQDAQQAYPLQRLEDWLGLEDDDMLTWAKEFVATKVKARRHDLIPEGIRLWDGRYWNSVEEFSGPDGVYLCRRSVNLFGNATHEYALTKFHRFSTIRRIDGYVTIDKEIARKLQGALRPTRSAAEQFPVTKVRAGIIQIMLPHPIAEQHSKLLSLGWKSRDSDTLKPGVQKIEFSEMLLPLLSKGFSLIGYELAPR